MEWESELESESESEEQVSSSHALRSISFWFSVTQGMHKGRERGNLLSSLTAPPLSFFALFLYSGSHH